MPIVTLTTDWASGDYYIARLKGAILQASANVSIIDITHHIQPYNTIQAAFVLRNAYDTFPAGTIHLIGVNSEPSAKKKLVAIQANEHFFIGINDGMFSLAFDGKEIEKTVELPEVRDMGGFRALPLFTYAVQELAAGKNISGLGKSCELKQDIQTKANYDHTGISGIIAYIDTFGNAVSNITRELFERVGQGRAFEITVQNNYNLITRISDYYDEVEEGGLLALFNSYDLLEIAMYQVNFAQLENLDTRSSIRIKFFDDRLF